MNDLLPIDCSATAWFALAPWHLLENATLRALVDYLNQPATQQVLVALEHERAYPHPVRQQLHRLGQSQFWVDPAIDLAPPGTATTEPLATFPHIAALVILCTAANASLGVTVGVNLLALIPIYLAGNQQQLGWMAQRLNRGDYAALCLTEIAHGSDLLANETRAEPGQLDSTGVFTPTSTEKSTLSATPPSHYRLHGRKDTINGGSQHELLVVFAHSQGNPSQPQPPRRRLAQRHHFDLWLVDRTEHPTAIAAPHRWHTLPTPGADIASVAFDKLVLPASQRLGEPGQGFALVQELFALVRGAVSLLALG